MDISIPYYEDNTRISNSAIGYFLKSPRFFKEKMLKIAPDEKSTSLSKGTMIHEYVLQPNEFYNDYVVYPSYYAKPTSPNQESFCEYMLNSTEIEPQKAAVSAYSKCYSIVGKSESKIASEAIEMANKMANYINILRENKTVISEVDLKKCEDLKYNIDNHFAANMLLNRVDVEEHHEFHINWEYKGVPCKSLIDCIQFDFENKLCTIIDLKTTAKIDHFEDSVNTYDYCRQLLFYTLAAQWYLSVERKVDISQWEFSWYIIALSTNPNNTVRVFEFTSEQIYSREDTINKVIDDIKWFIGKTNESLMESLHSKMWDHTRAYWENGGIEHLDL